MQISPQIHIVHDMGCTRIDDMGCTKSHCTRYSIFRLCTRVHDMGCTICTENNNHSNVYNIHFIFYQIFIHVHICLRYMLDVQHVVKLCTFVSVHTFNVGDVHVYNKCSSVHVYNTEKLDYFHSKMKWY